MNAGEVWFVHFPFEEDPNQFRTRPCVVLDVEKLEVLSIKVTTHGIRDEYDIPILNWRTANLRKLSYARTSKAVAIPKRSFLQRIGNIHKNDFQNIIEAYIKYNKQ